MWRTAGRALATILALGLGGATTPAVAVLKRPNVVVIMFDDMSPRVGAFGDRLARTPNLDALAREAIAYPNTFTTAPVCAPSRAALFSGRYQQTIAAQNMRTSGAAGLPGGGPMNYQATPPAEVKWLPELLRRAGYFTINVGKTDYQIGEPFTIWDVNAMDADWRNRPKDRPFFAFINLARTHESYIWPEATDSKSPLAQRVAQRNRAELAGKPKLTDPASVLVPPYLPDTPVVRADIARVYDNIAFEERQVGVILDQLRAEGILDKTVVIVTADHGDGLPRMKRAIYDAGLRVPLLVRLPGGAQGGTRRDQLVSFVDLAPTILALTRTPRPAWMQGQVFLGPGAQPRKLAFAATDRFDETPGRQRTVIDERFQYVRNYRPDLAFLRPLTFRDILPSMQEIWRLRDEKRLPPDVAQYVTAPQPIEELFDLKSDPHTVRNIAGRPEAAKDLARLREALGRWKTDVGDQADVPELEMVEAMWPGRIQPATAPVEAQPSRGGLALESATRGASVGYRLAGDVGWRLYTAPLRLRSGAAVETKAIRYGYAESPVTRLSVP